jgi:type IV pilus assembly protein PilA
VAIPAYSDYIARAQMSEAMTLTSGVKTPLAEWIADRGSLPVRF